MTIEGTRIPGQATERARRRTAVLVVVAVVAAVGAALFVGHTWAAARVFYAAAILAAVLSLLTALVGWVILRRLAPLVRAEPTDALRCVAWGLTALGFAALANDGLKNIWAREFGIDFNGEWGSALTAPLDEELLKLAGLTLLALALAPMIRGPMEGFIYGAFVGLGFQVGENWLYAVNGVLLSGGTGGLPDVVQILFLRVTLTGLSSHWALTAIAGTGLGFLITRRGSHRRAAVGVGLVLLAILLHFLFDSPLPPSPAGIVVRALLNFVVAMTIYLTLRRRFRAAAATYLSFTGTPAELIKRRHRRDALREITDPAIRQAFAGLQCRQLAAAADYAYRTG